MKKTEERKWLRTSDDLYEKFAAELESGIETGEKVSSGDQDIKYGIELWRNRLNKKKLGVSYDIIPRGLFADSSHSREWKDEHYSSKVYHRTCRLNKAVYVDGKEVYSNGDNKVMYQTVTDILDGARVEDDFYCCPNCGANVKIGELVEGCPYCGTFFKMDELYPKVSGYYFISDFGETENELKSEIGKIIWPMIIGFSILFTFVFSVQKNGTGHSLLLSAIPGVLFGFIFGGFLGYILWVYKKLGKLFKEAGKSIVLLSNTAGSNKKFENCMKKYSPEFSFEYFQSKVVSMIRVIVFSDNPVDLPFYTGDGVNGCFDDVIDTDFRGALALRSIKEENGKICAYADAYMINTYERNGKVKRKEEKINVELERRTDIPIDYGFSIKKIQCPGCAGSFDATKNRTCPYCGNSYDIEDMDWVVKSIKIVK